MAVLLTCESIEKSFGSRTVFSDISFSLHDDERLGIIGPNGAGKSTFLSILAGLTKPDAGKIAMRKGARMALVPQDPVFDPEALVMDIVVAAAGDSDDAELEAAKILSKTGFENAWVEAGSLSGGWKKRLAIAVALAQKPDIMLLDEPTNHLDVEGILWLEKMITNAPFGSVFVTHDRYFLENTATRVAEINRSYPLGLFTASGNYSKFLEKRSEFLKAQSRQQEALENLVAREIEWLRRGAKARTTKSKARIQDAEDLQEQLADVTQRNVKGTAGVDFTASGRMTKRLITCEGVSKSMGGRVLFEDVKLMMGPGVRLGIMGSNGSGKTTLLRILTGELESDTGEVRRADNIQLAYFDQNRDKIDMDQTLKQALADSGDTVIFRGRPQHVAGWAARFLFRQDQLELPLKQLSGGERARVHIARLMLQPADVLILDEPTNDLDIPTLEVLEGNLADFPGAIVLVTHDRFLLDRLSSLILAIDGTGATEFYAELAQWEAASQVKKPKAAKPGKAVVKAETQAVVAPPPPAAPKKKLSYKDQREWDEIEGKIHAADERLTRAKAGIEKPEVATDPKTLTAALAEIDAAQAEVDALFHRWSELEALQNA